MKKLLFALPFALVVLTACPNKKDSLDFDPSKERKVGYLFYTSFIDEFNPRLYETFARFKAAGITDLIVDLRYNHGGSIGAAGYLASLIAPRSAVQSKSVFSQLDFNSFLNSYYDARGGRSYKLGEFGSGQSNPLGANLNLNTVYIIATSDSYSASELLTFCLRPYMNVVHIGEETGGKFTASMTVTAYDSYGNKTNTIYEPAELSQGAKDSLKDWAMQPIVAIYKDSRNRDFATQATLVPNVPVTSRENDSRAYLPLGNPADYLIAATISKIKGDNLSAVLDVPTIARSVSTLQPAKLYVAKDALLKEAVLWRTNAESNQTSVSASVNTVSQFVYDGMSVFYKWADDMAGKTPTASDSDPVSYFKKVLHPLDTQHGWSWITDDVNSLLSDFSGEPVDFGWGLNLLWADASRTRIVAVVKYVYPNTPAANAGITRGDVISQINGNNITNNEGDAGYYMKLFGGSMINVAVTGANGATRSVGLTPVRISTNPVLKDTVYTVKK